MYIDFSILNNDFFKCELYNNINAKILYLHILKNANIEDKEWCDIIIKKGEFVSSLRKISKDLNIPERQLRTLFKKFQDNRLIKFETTKTYTKISIIIKEKYSHRNDTVNDTVLTQDNIQLSIENISVVEDIATQNKSILDTLSDTEVTTTIYKDINININNKKEKINKKEKSVPPLEDEEKLIKKKLIEEWYETYIECAKKYKYKVAEVLNEDRERIIGKLIKKGHAVSDFKLILDFYHNDKWFRNSNYDTLDGFTRLGKFQERLEKARHGLKIKNELNKKGIIKTQTKEEIEKIENFKKMYKEHIEEMKNNGKDKKESEGNLSEAN